MADASSGLLRLRPVTFRYKQPLADGSKPVQYGLIAEEVEQVYPDLVARSADGKIESVKYQLLDPMLVNAFSEDGSRDRRNRCNHRIPLAVGSVVGHAFGLPGQAFHVAGCQNLASYLSEFSRSFGAKGFARKPTRSPSRAPPFKPAG